MSTPTPINNGGPAFPGKAYLYSGAPHPSDTPGMTLRDWFAGQALIALYHSRLPIYPGEIPAKAYRVADDMIAARNNPSTTIP